MTRHAATVRAAKSAVTRYKAYADGRKTALENRYTACIEGTGRKRSHERWLDQQKRRAH
jgi:hypothetical protein